MNAKKVLTVLNGLRLIFIL